MTQPQFHPLNTPKRRNGISSLTGQDHGLCSHHIIPGPSLTSLSDLQRGENLSFFASLFLQSGFPGPTPSYFENKEHVQPNLLL